MTTVTVTEFLDAPIIGVGVIGELGEETPAVLYIQVLLSVNRSTSSDSNT